MSGPSGANTKASKIERVLNRQLSINDDIGDMFELIRIGHETDATTIDRLTNSLKLATETANRLEAENDKLRKYLGSELFARRQREIPTLEPLPGMPAWDGTKVRNELRLARAQARIGLAADGTRWDLREILTAIAEGREIRLGVTGAPSLEPAWGNRPDPVPHTTKETV